MKNYHQIFIFVILFATFSSCRKEPSENTMQIPETNSLQIGTTQSLMAKDTCFDLSAFSYERLEMIGVRFHNNQLFTEYDLRFEGSYPVFYDESILSDSLVLNFRKLEIWGEKGTFEEYFVLISGQKDDVNSIAGLTLNHTPPEFIGTILIFDMSGTFTEGKVIRNGQIETHLSKENSTSCTELNANAAVDRNGGDCITILYTSSEAFQQVEVITTTWLQLTYLNGNTNIQILDETTNYITTTHTLYNNGTYLYCPGNPHENIPYGDDGGGVDRDRKACLKEAKDLIENNRIISPCQPDLTSFDIINAAIGGLENCVSLDFLNEKLTETGNSFVFCNQPNCDMDMQFKQFLCDLLSIDLSDPCNPENSSSSNIQKVLNEMNGFSSNEFWKVHEQLYGDCDIDFSLNNLGLPTYFKTCPKSFEWTVSDDAQMYVAEVTDLFKVFWYSLIGFKSLSVPKLCVSVSTDYFDTDLTSQITASAMDKAFEGILLGLSEGIMTEDNVTPFLFAEIFRNRLLDEFQAAMVTDFGCISGVFSNPLVTKIEPSCWN